MKAFPLLIALLKDDYLVATDLLGRYSHSYTYYGSSEGEFMDEEKIQELYDRMPRPATRGEIADRLLRPVVLDSQDRHRSDLDPNAVRQQALHWYSQHKNKTEGELARYYLEQDKGENRRAAIQALTQSNSPDDRQVIEKHFLESKNIAQEVDMVSLYVMRRGEDAREFVDKYLARIKANPALLQPATSDDLRVSNKVSKYQQQHVKQVLATLEQLVSSKSAEAMLEESLNSKQKWTEAAWSRNSTSLMRKLAKEEPQKRLGMLLNAAVKAQDMFLVQKFLELIIMLPHLQAYQANCISSIQAAAWAEAAPSSKLSFDMTAHAGAWRKLLADTRPMTESEDFTMSGRVTVGQFAGIVAERLFASGGADRLEEYTQQQQLGDKVYAIYHARAEARLAGKPESALPPFPSKKNVSTERRKAIQAELTAVSGELLRQRVATLTSDECLVLYEIAATEAQLNAKLAAFANVVSHVQVTLDAPVLKRQAEAFKGKPLDRKMVETLVEAAKTLLKSGKPVQISVARDACLEGIKIRVEKPGAMARMFGQSGMTSLNKAVLVAYLHTSKPDQSCTGYATWLVDLPAKPATPVKKSNESDDTDKLEQSAIDAFGERDGAFWKSLETVCTPKFNACEAVAILLMGMVPDPGKTDDDVSPVGFP